MFTAPRVVAACSIPVVVILFGISPAQQAQVCGKGEVLWEVPLPDVNLPECTCADLPELFSWLEAAKTFRELYRKIADDLRVKEAAGLSVLDSQDEFKRQETAKTGALQTAQNTSGSFATTEGALGQCYTCVPSSNLKKCRAFLESAWAHERVHRDACRSREQSRTDPYKLAGSVHAAEEQLAYAAQIPALVKEIDRLLKKVRIEWTTSGTDYNESGSAQLDGTVVAEEELFKLKGGGSVRFNLQSLNAIAGGTGPSCRTTRGAPAAVPVNETLELSLTASPPSAVFTVSTANIIVPHTFKCSGPISGSITLPIQYVGAAYFFDHPIKDGSTATRISPPSPPGTLHTNFRATLKCIK